MKWIYQVTAEEFWKRNGTNPQQLSETLGRKAQEEVYGTQEAYAAEVARLDQTDPGRVRPLLQGDLNDEEYWERFYEVHESVRAHQGLPSLESTLPETVEPSKTQQNINYYFKNIKIFDTVLKEIERRDSGSEEKEWQESVKRFKAEAPKDEIEQSLADIRGFFPGCKPGESLQSYMLGEIDKLAKNRKP